MDRNMYCVLTESDNKILGKLVHYVLSNEYAKDPKGENISSETIANIMKDLYSKCISSGSAEKAYIIASAIPAIIISQVNNETCDAGFKVAMLKYAAEMQGNIISGETINVEELNNVLGLNAPFHNIIDIEIAEPKSTQSLNKSVLNSYTYLDEVALHDYIQNLLGDNENPVMGKIASTTAFIPGGYYTVNGVDMILKDINDNFNTSSTPWLQTEIANNANEFKSYIFEYYDPKSDSVKYVLYTHKDMLSLDIKPQKALKDGMYIFQASGDKLYDLAAYVKDGEVKTIYGKGKTTDRSFVTETLNLTYKIKNAKGKVLYSDTVAETTNPFSLNDFTEQFSLKYPNELVYDKPVRFNDSTIAIQNRKVTQVAIVDGDIAYPIFEGQNANVGNWIGSRMIKSIQNVSDNATYEINGVPYTAKELGLRAMYMNYGKVYPITESQVINKSREIKYNTGASDFARNIVLKHKDLNNIDGKNCVFIKRGDNLILCEVVDGKFIDLKFDNNGNLSAEGNALTIPVAASYQLAELPEGAVVNSYITNGYDKTHKIINGIQSKNAVPKYGKDGLLSVDINGNQYDVLRPNTSNLNVAEKIAQRLIGFRDDVKKKRLDYLVGFGQNADAKINELMAINDLNEMIDALMKLSLLVKLPKMVNGKFNSIFNNVDDYVSIAILNEHIGTYNINFIPQEKSDINEPINTDEPSQDVSTNETPDIKPFEFSKLKKPQRKSTKAQIEISEKQLKDAEDWFNNSPLKEYTNISVVEKVMLDRSVKNQKDVIAYWTTNLITLSNASDKTDIYHEAFHEFFEMLLSDKDRSDLYKELRKVNKTFVNAEGNTINLKDATNNDLDEVLAEGFRVYMLTGKIPYYCESKKARTLLQWFKDVLKWLFNGAITEREKKSKVRNMYNMLKNHDKASMDLLKAKNYDTNYRRTTRENTIKCQTVLQKVETETFDINPQYLDNYKIVQDGVSKSLLDVAFIAAWQRHNYYLTQKGETAYADPNDEQLASIPKEDKIDYINEYYNYIAPYLYQQYKSSQLVDNNDQKTKVPIEHRNEYVPDVTIKTTDGYGLSRQSSRDITDLMTNIYVSYMNNYIANGMGNFLAFRKDMSTQYGKRNFYKHAKNTLLAMRKTASDTYMQNLLDFAIKNFGDLENLSSNYEEHNGRVYGVIGYFEKKNKMFFSKSIMSREDVLDGSKDDPDDFVAALMGNDRSGNETPLKDLIKDEVKIILSTITERSYIEEDGAYVVDENGNKRIMEKKNKFNKYFGNSNLGFNCYAPVRTMINKINEIVKNTPDFNSFVEKVMYAAQKDPELMDIYTRIGAISNEEFESKRFDSDDKFVMWNLMYQSFNNAQMKGKLVRIDCDFSTVDPDDSSKYVSRMSVVTGSAVENDIMNVLNSDFRNNMNARVQSDMILDDYNKTADVKITVDSSDEDKINARTEQLAKAFYFASNYGGHTPGYEIFSENNRVHVKKSVSQVTSVGDIDYIEFDSNVYDKDNNLIGEKHIILKKTLVNGYYSIENISDDPTIDINLIKQNNETITDDRDCVGIYMTKGTSMFNDGENYVDARCALGAAIVSGWYMNVGNLRKQEDKSKDLSSPKSFVAFFDVYNAKLYKNLDNNGTIYVTRNNEDIYGYNDYIEKCFALSKRDRVKPDKRDDSAVVARGKKMMLRTFGLFVGESQAADDYYTSPSSTTGFVDLIAGVIDSTQDSTTIKDVRKYSLFDIFSGGAKYYIYKNVIDIESGNIKHSSSYSQPTGDNTNSFENSLNNTMSVMANSINQALDDNVDQSGKIKHESARMSIEIDMPWFNRDRNPMLGSSVIYKKLFGVVELLSTNKEDFSNYPQRGYRLEVTRPSGIEVVAGGAHIGGSNAYQSDEVSRYINDFRLAMDGVFCPIQHSDKKSVIAVSLNDPFNFKYGKLYMSKSYVHMIDCMKIIAGDKSMYSDFVNIMYKKEQSSIDYFNRVKRDRDNGTLGKASYKAVDAIIKNEGHSYLYDVIVGYGKNADLYNQIVSNENVFNGNINEVIDIVSNYIDSKINELRDKVGEFAVPQNVKDKLMPMAKNHNVDFTGDNFYRDSMMYHYMINSIIHGSELMTLMYGDTNQYKDDVDFTKRVGPFGSTGLMFESSDWMSNHFADEISKSEQAAGESRDRSKFISWTQVRADRNNMDSSQIVKSLEFGKTLRTVVCQDVNVVSYYESQYKEHIGDDSAAYGDYKESDAFALVSFDKYRQLLIAESKWTDEHEKMFMDIIHGKPLNINHVKKLFQPIKALYVGPLASNIDNMAEHKYQLYPIIPTLFEENDLVTQLHDQMVKNGIAYVVFKSGSKISDITDVNGKLPNIFTTKDGKKAIADNFHQQIATVEMLQNANGNLVGNTGKIVTEGNTIKYHKAGINGSPATIVDLSIVDGKLVDNNGAEVVINDYINEIYTPYLKDQLVIHDEFEGNIVLPTQLRKLISSNFFDNGVPVDFAKSYVRSDKKASNEDILKAWDSLTSDEKIQKSQMWDKVSKYIKALYDLRDLKKREIMDKIYDKDTDGNYTAINNYKLHDFICDLIEQEELPDEFKDYFELVDGKFVRNIEQSINSGRLENLIVKRIDREVSKFRVYGETLVQASNTLFNDGTNFAKVVDEKYGFPPSTNGLPFYTLENGKVKSMKVKVPLSGKFKSLLDLADGNTDREKLNDLNQKLKDKEWFESHKDLVTMIAVRIPTQGHNSIEVMEVWEFLPPEGPNSIILPSEIVVKSGGDYDIDKMPIMMPHISKVVTERDGEIVRTVKLDNDITDDELKETGKILERIKTEAQSKLVNKLMAEAIDESLIDPNSGLTVDTLKDYVNELIDKFAQVPNNKSEFNSMRKSANDLYKKYLAVKKAYNQNSEFGELASRLLSYMYGAWTYSPAKNYYDKAKRDSYVYTNTGTTMTAGMMRESYRKYKEDVKRLNNAIASYSTMVYNDLSNDVRALVDEYESAAVDLQANRDSRIMHDVNMAENTLQRTMEDIMRDSTTFKTLITPNSTSNFEDVKAKYNPEKGAKLRSMSFIDPIRNMDDRLRFVAGKDGLGIAAVDNTLGMIFNTIGLGTNLKIFDKKSKKVYPVSLRLNYNYLEVVDGKKYGINLSRMYAGNHLIGEDADFLYNIQNTISQLMNGYVDVAKDAWVRNIGADKTRTPAFLYMLNAGVSIEDAVSLLMSKYVEQFCKIYDERRGAMMKLTKSESSALKLQILKDMGVIDKDDKKFEYNRYTLARINSQMPDLYSNYTTDKLDRLRADDEKVDTGYTIGEYKLFEFLWIMELSDDLTEVKIKFSQDTTINESTVDIENSSIISDNSTIDTSTFGKIKQTPIGPFNDKAFIVSIVRSIGNNSSAVSDWSNLRNFVLDNAVDLKKGYDGTIGQLYMELNSTLNLIHTQRAIRGTRTGRYSQQLIAQYYNHEYPNNIKLTLDEFAKFKEQLDTITDIPEFFIERSKQIASSRTDIDITNDNIMETAKVYYALSKIWNHSTIFNSEFSFSDRFMYMKNKYQNRISIAFFDLLSKSRDRLLAVEAKDDDIFLLKDNMEVLGDENELKSRFGLSDTEAAEMVDFINDMDLFCMLQSDGNVEGVFNISVLASDIHRQELISQSVAERSVEPKEVLMQWKLNRSKKTAKYFDGYVTLTNDAIIIDGVRYVRNENSENALSRIDFSLPYKTMIMDVYTSMRDYIDTNPDHYKDSDDAIYVNIGGWYYKRDLGTNMWHLLTSVDDIMVAENALLNGYTEHDGSMSIITGHNVVGGVIIAGNANKIASEINGISTDKPVGNVIGIDYSNPFDTNGDSWLSASDGETATNLYVSYISDDKEISFTNNNGDNVYMNFGYKEADFDGVKVPANTAYVYHQDGSVDSRDLSSIAKKRSELFRAIISGSLYGKTVVSSDEYVDWNKDFKVKYDGKLYRSAAMVLNNAINNPSLLGKMDQQYSIQNSRIVFEQSPIGGYPHRTMINATASDVTIDLFAKLSAGYNLTKKFAGDKFVDLPILDTEINLDDAITKAISDAVRIIGANKKAVVNIAGNSLNTIADYIADDEILIDKLSQISGVKINKNLSNLQDAVNAIAAKFIVKLHSALGDRISYIRSGGQTGFDTAGIIAADRLGISTLVYAPRGWMSHSDTDYNATQYGELSFKKRFANGKYVSKNKPLVDSVSKPIPVEQKIDTDKIQSSAKPEYSITYTRSGVTREYTVKGSHIYNKNGDEVFATDSVDRNRIFANLAVKQGRAVVVDINGEKYVVNDSDKIISVATGKIMKWSDNDGKRRNIIAKAHSIFESRKLGDEAFRVADIERDDWNRDDELKWIDRTLPQFTQQQRIEILDTLIPTGSFVGKGKNKREIKAWGRYGNGMITLSDKAADGTTYHEAFHAVFRECLTNEERNMLLNEMRLYHKDMSDIELEEELAEDFRRFVQGKELKHTKSNLFVRFCEWLKLLVENWKKYNLAFDFNKTIAQQYYERINSGYYANVESKEKVAGYAYSVEFAKDDRNYDNYRMQFEKYRYRERFMYLEQAKQAMNFLKDKYPLLYPQEPEKIAKGANKGKWRVPVTEPVLSKYTRAQLDKMHMEQQDKINARDLLRDSVNSFYKDLYSRLKNDNDYLSEMALIEQEVYYGDVNDAVSSFVKYNNGVILYGSEQDIDLDDYDVFDISDDNCSTGVKNSISDGRKVAVKTTGRIDADKSVKINYMELTLDLFDEDKNSLSLPEDNPNVTDGDVIDDLNNCK